MTYPFFDIQIIKNIKNRIRDFFTLTNEKTEWFVTNYISTVVYESRSYKKAIMTFLSRTILSILVLGILHYGIDVILIQICGGYGKWNFVHLINLDIDDSIFSSIIEIYFTLLGFAITFRSILIGMHTSRFNGFSMRNLINYGTDWICKFLWYIILILPFLGLFDYIKGYRFRLIIIAFVLGICVIIYFATIILERLL